MRAKTVALLAAIVAWLTGGIFVVKRWQHRKTRDLAHVAGCKRCIQLLKVRAGLSLIAHLIDEHSMSEDEAMDTVKRAYLRFLQHSNGCGQS